MNWVFPNCWGLLDSAVVERKNSSCSGRSLRRSGSFDTYCITLIKKARSHESSDPPTARLHLDRVTGGHCDHRHPDWPVAAGGAKGSRSGQPHEMHEQPQAAWPGNAQLSRRQQSVPDGGAGLALSRSHGLPAAYALYAVFAPLLRAGQRLQALQLHSRVQRCGQRCRDRHQAADLSMPV